MEKLSWKLKKEVGSAILEAGGQIFGGYVRDTIIHDHYAKLYYEKTAKQEEDSYNNPTYLPEYKDRTLLPEDIDCFFPSMEYRNAFERILSHHKFCFKRVFVRADASEYIPRLQKYKNTLSHIRYKVFLINSNKASIIRMLLLQNIPASVRHELSEEVNELMDQFVSKLHDTPSVTIDALISNNTLTALTLQPPFGGLDFECNGLILTKHGLSLADDLKEKQTSHGFIADMNKIASVHADILKRKAVLVKGSIIDKYRITKMQKKGWEICHGDLINIERIDPSEEDDCSCIICHNNFKSEQDCFKLKCCAARYHKDCLIEAAQKGIAAMTATKVCIMCKQTTAIQLGNDISILQCLE